MTRGDLAKILMENGDEFPWTRSDPAFLAEVVSTGKEPPIFMCGEGAPGPVCPCAHLSDVLCDWPIGGGKTCDLPLCEDCSHHIGDDRDLCAIHFAMFAKKAKPARVFLKGPRLVR